MTLDNLTRLSFKAAKICASAMSPIFLTRKEHCPQAKPYGRAGTGSVCFIRPQFSIRVRHVGSDAGFRVSLKSHGDVFPETVRSDRVVFQILKSGLNILKDFPRINAFVDIDPCIIVADTDAD